MKGQGRLRAGIYSALILSAVALPPAAAADNAPRAKKATPPSTWSHPKRVISLKGGWIDTIRMNAKGQAIVSGGAPWQIVFLRRDRSVAARIDAKDGAVQPLSGPDAHGGAYVRSADDLIKLDAHGHVVHQRKVPGAVSLSENDRGDVAIVWRQRSVLDNGGISDIGDVWFSFRPAGGAWGPDTILGQADEDTAWGPQVHVDDQARTIVTWQRGQKLMVVRRPAAGPASAPIAEGGNIGGWGVGGLLASADGTDGMVFPESGVSDSRSAMFGGYPSPLSGPIAITAGGGGLAGAWMAPSGRTLLTWMDSGSSRFVAKFRPPHGRFAARHVLAKFSHRQETSPALPVSFDKHENGVVAWPTRNGAKLQAAVVKRSGKFCRTETIGIGTQNPHPVVDPAGRASIFYGANDAVYSITRRAKPTARCKFAR